VGVRGRIKRRKKATVKKKVVKKKGKGLSHQDVVDYSAKVLDRSGKQWKCGVIFKEISSASAERPDVIGFYSGGSSLIEAKVSRTDFLKDKKKRFRMHPELGMGKYRFYACPTNLIKESELPKDWGLIYVTEKGRCTVKVKPKAQKLSIDSEHLFMYSVLRRTLIYMDGKQLNEFAEKSMDTTQRNYYLNSLK